MLKDPSSSPQISLPHREAPLRVRLIDFYTKHNPAAISRVDKILERYHGREVDMWHDLCQKYIIDEGGTFDITTTSCHVELLD